MATIQEEILRGIYENKSGTQWESQTEGKDLGIIISWLIFKAIKAI